MTERRDGGSALPLSVTCSPDDRFADAVRALVERVGALAGSADRAQPFRTAVEQVVAWLLAHRDAVAGDVAMRFDRDGEQLLGHLRWAASDASSLPGPPPDPSADVQVACDRDGSEVHCRVSCRCT